MSKPESNQGMGAMELEMLKALKQLEAGNADVRSAGRGGKKARERKRAHGGGPATDSVEPITETQAVTQSPEVKVEQPKDYNRKATRDEMSTVRQYLDEQREQMGAERALTWLQQRERNVGGKGTNSVPSKLITGIASRLAGKNIVDWPDEYPGMTPERVSRQEQPPVELAQVDVAQASRQPDVAPPEPVVAETKTGIDKERAGEVAYRFLNRYKGETQKAAKERIDQTVASLHIDVTAAAGKKGNLDKAKLERILTDALVNGVISPDVLAYPEKDRKQEALAEEPKVEVKVEVKTQARREVQKHPVSVHHEVLDSKDSSPAQVLGAAGALWEISSKMPDAEREAKREGLVRKYGRVVAEAAKAEGVANPFEQSTESKTPSEADLKRQYGDLLQLRREKKIHDGDFAKELRWLIDQRNISREDRLEMIRQIIDHTKKTIERTKRPEAKTALERTVKGYEERLKYLETEANPRKIQLEVDRSNVRKLIYRPESPTQKLILSEKIKAVNELLQITKELAGLDPKKKQQYEREVAEIEAHRFKLWESAAYSEKVPPEFRIQFNELILKQLRDELESTTDEKTKAAKQQYISRWERKLKELSEGKPARTEPVVDSKAAAKVDQPPSVQNPTGVVGQEFEIPTKASASGGVEFETGDPDAILAAAKVDKGAAVTAEVQREKGVIENLQTKADKLLSILGQVNTLDKLNIALKAFDLLEQGVNKEYVPGGTSPEMQRLLDTMDEVSRGLDQKRSLLEQSPVMTGPERESAVAKLRTNMQEKIRRHEVALEAAERKDAPLARRLREISLEIGQNDPQIEELYKDTFGLPQDVQDMFGRFGSLDARLEGEIKALERANTATVETKVEISDDQLREWAIEAFDEGVRAELRKDGVEEDELEASLAHEKTLRRYKSNLEAHVTAMVDEMKKSL